MSTQVAAPQAAPQVAPARPQPRLYVPLVLIMTTVMAWALTLNNGIFIDESVYIRSGRAIIDNWINGTPLPQWVGQGFSGHPQLYPVFAGMLDMAGGLALVRLFSLFCIIATMLILRSIANEVFNRRAGLVTAAIFGLTGPVLYVGHLGTFDALVILLLVSAWWVGMQDGLEMTVAFGAIMGLAVATKYTAYVFVPPLLVLSLFRPYGLTHSADLRTWLRPRVPWKRIRHAVIAGLIAVDIALLVYVTASKTIREALMFTTIGRDALSPTPRGELIGTVPNFVWPTFFAAVLGLIWLYRARRWNAVLWGVVLLGTSLLLPVAQIKLGEGVSFQKHLAYSAAFLAPLAGWGFARPWKLAIWTPVLCWWLILMAVWGMFRSNDLIMYPDVRPVAQVMDFTKQGTYLSSSADSLNYYTRENPAAVWETTFELYSKGDDIIRLSVEQGWYNAFIIHAGPTGSTIQDAGQKVLLDALDKSNYTLTEVGEDGEWLIYTA